MSNNNAIAAYFRRKNIPNQSVNFAPGLSPRTPRAKKKPASPPMNALRKFLPTNLKKAIENHRNMGFKPVRELARTPVTARKYSPKNFGSRKVVQRSPEKQLNYVKMALDRVRARKPRRKIPNNRIKIKNQSPFVQIFNGKNTVSSVLEEPILKTPTPKPRPKT
jgi:hypothetical protein